MEDFVVETEGQCFLCLDKILPIKLEPECLESEAMTVTSSTHHSIRHWSRYLGVNNLREMYRNEDKIMPSNLGTIGGRSRLKLELCEECASLNELLSKQCQQLEKIELEVVSSLEQIRRRLLIADETGRGQQFLDDGHVDEMITTSLGGVKGKFQIAEQLRVEALEKCSKKLKLASPRVKLQKLTLNQLDEERRKIRAKSIGQGCWRTTKSGRCSPSSASTSAILAEPIKSESYPESDEEEDDEYPDDAVEAFEPPPLSPVLNVPDMGSNQECDDPEESLLSNPIIIAQPQLKVEHESYPESETEARNTIMTGKSTKEVNTKKTMNPTFHDSSIAIPPPIKVAGVADVKFQSSVDGETGKHRCSSCSKQFTGPGALWNHYQSVHLKVRFSCTECGKEFTRYNSYRVHYQNLHMQINIEASSEPSPLPSNLSVLEIDSNQGCELRRPKDSELSTPIITTPLEVEREFHPVSGNSLDASHKTLMIGKSTLEISPSPQQRMNSTIADYSVTIPAPIKVSGGSTGKFRTNVDPNTGKHLCGCCSKQFASRGAAWTHYQSQHLNLRYKCSVCWKEFGRSEAYREHYQNLHMHVRFNCQLCNKAFHNKRALSVHQRSVHLGLRFKCKFCPSTFSKADNRNRHMKSVHFGFDKKEGNEPSCVVMDASSEPTPVSPLSPSLKEPCAIHHPEDSELSTPITIAHLKSEQESHPNSENSSKVCPKTQMSGEYELEVNFKKTVKLTIEDFSVDIPAPIKLVGVDAGKPLRCSVDLKTRKRTCSSCSKQFTGYHALWTHFQTEHLEVRYKCTNCGKEFALPQNYRAHYRRFHMAVRYTCQHCDKTFGHKNTLSQHHRHHRIVHLGVFKCDFCPEIFIKAEDRTRHMQTSHRKTS